MRDIWSLLSDRKTTNDKRAIQREERNQVRERESVCVYVLFSHCMKDTRSQSKEERGVCGVFTSCSDERTSSCRS